MEEEVQEPKIRYTLTQVTDLLEFNSVADQVERFIQPEHGKLLQVISIEKVTNNYLEEKYLVRQDGMFGFSIETTKLKFHGTSSRALHKILNGGFKIPTNPGMYGRGIYFATDSSKSAQYAKDEKKLLLCEVALGKAMIVTSADNTLDFATVYSKGFDSVYAPRNTKGTQGVLFDEFVIYHKHQAIPRYVITYKEESLPQSPVTSSKTTIVPYSDEPILSKSPNPDRPLLEGPIRWKKSEKSSRWSERFVYVLEGRIIAIFKNMKQCKEAVDAIHRDIPTNIVPEASIDLAEVDNIEVKEELDVQIITITMHDGRTEYIIPASDAYGWLKSLLNIKLELKNFQQSLLDNDEQDSDEEVAPKPVDPKMSEFEARKQARKMKIGLRVDVRQAEMKAKKEKVIIYDEATGAWLGVLDSEDAILELPKEFTRSAVFKGILAVKTEQSWRILYCVFDGKYLIAYKASVSDSKKKRMFDEHKRWDITNAQVRKTTFQFHKRIVGSLMVIIENRPTLFVGKNIQEWHEMMKKFALTGSSSNPILTEKEKKRWESK